MRKGGLREYPIPLKVGQPEILPAKGNYLRVRAALADLIIEIGDNDIYKMAAGEDVAYSVDEEFSQIRVTSLAGVDEIVNIQVGSNVRVTSSKLNGSITVQGVAQVAGIVDTSNRYSLPFVLDNFATQVNEILAPAANVNGAIVLNAQIMASMAENTGIMAFSLIAKDGPPANLKDGDVLMALRKNRGTANTTMYDGQVSLANPVKVDAGKGLYLFVAGGATATGIATATTKVL